MAEGAPRHNFSHIVHATSGRASGSFVLHGKGVAWRNNTSKEVFKINKDKLRTATWSRSGRWCLLHLTTTANYERFDGFRVKDYEVFKEYFKEHFGGLALNEENFTARGLNVGQLDFDDRRSSLALKFEDKKSMEIALSRISQCVAPNKNEVEFQFEEDESGPQQDEVLVEMRMYIPPNQDGEDEAAIWQDDIVKRAGVRGAGGNALVDLDETIGNFLTPRGKYRVELHDTFMRMKGKTYDYTIAYSSFHQMFILPKNDGINSYFVISLSDPIRQGQQRYRHLVMQVDNSNRELSVNMEPGELKEKYKGRVKPVHEDPTPDLLGRFFHVFTEKKVFRTGDYRSARNQCAVKCSLKANDGFLYPLRTSFFFVHKPATYIRYNEIDSIEFLRYQAGSGSARSFDLEVTCRAVDGENPIVHTFSQIDKSEYKELFAFLSTKKLRIKNIKAAQAVAENNGESAQRGGFAEMDLGGEEESGDSDFGSDDGHPSDASEDSDSDVSIVDIGAEDAEMSAKKPRKSKKRKIADEAVSGKSKAKKPKKDPNAPKRGQSAYNYFMKDKHKEVVAGNPDMANKDILTRIGGMWKAATPDDKAKYEKLAKADKERYETAMKSYVPSEEYKQASKAADKKKKKKKKADPNAPKKNLSAYMMFCNAKRKELTEKGTDLAPKEVMRHLGELWRAASEEDKAPFVDAADKDKERYTKEMESYTPPKEEESSDSESESSSSSSSGSESDDDDDDSNSE